MTNSLITIAAAATLCNRSPRLIHYAIKAGDLEPIDPDTLLPAELHGHYRRIGKGALLRRDDVERWKEREHKQVGRPPNGNCPLCDGRGIVTTRTQRKIPCSLCRGSKNIPAILLGPG